MCDCLKQLNERRFVVRLGQVMLSMLVAGTGGSMLHVYRSFAFTIAAKRGIMISWCPVK